MPDAITQVGLVAGEIWHFINDKGGEATLSALLSSINHSQQVVFMSLGWLAREGQVFLEEKDSDFKVVVKKR
jgi:hypothetical protein